MNVVQQVQHATGPRAVVVDINHELRWWRDHYLQYPVGRTTYAQAEPTLKFAYDNYLLHPHQSLDAIWPDMHRRYEQLLPYEQLPWHRAKRIIGEVWQRITSD